MLSHLHAPLYLIEKEHVSQQIRQTAEEQDFITVGKWSGCVPLPCVLILHACINACR